MLYRINPQAFIKAHFLTFRDARNGKLCHFEIALQFILATFAAYWHLTHHKVDGDTVGIVISAASIVAGLMLNLMVLIYTLLVSKVDSSKTTSSNIDDFRLLCEETLANIAFSVFLCVILVVGSLLVLGPEGWLANTGQFIMVFSGTILIVTLLVVLKRCYALISYNLGVI